jgi:hypothetical protein
MYHKVTLFSSNNAHNVYKLMNTEYHDANISQSLAFIINACSHLDTSFLPARRKHTKKAVGYADTYIITSTLG